MRTLLALIMVFTFGVANAQIGQMVTEEQRQMMILQQKMQQLQMQMQMKQALAQFQMTSTVILTCAVYYEREEVNKVLADGLKAVVDADGQERNYPAEQVTAFKEAAYASINEKWDVLKANTDWDDVEKSCKTPYIIGRATGKEITPGNLIMETYEPLTSGS